MNMPVGARDPETIELTLVRDSTDTLDFRTIDDVSEIVVVTPQNQTVTWAWTITSATESQIKIVHTFALDGSDVPIRGGYVAHGWLVTPTTRRRINPLPLPPAVNL